MNGEMIMKDTVPMMTEETETIWNYCKFHIGDWVSMYTTDKVMIRRYEKFSQKYSDHCKLVKEDQYSKTFSIDPACMGIKPRAPRKGPAISDEQKRINAERLKHLRKAKNV